VGYIVYIIVHRAVRNQSTAIDCEIEYNPITRSLVPSATSSLVTAIFIGF